MGETEPGYIIRFPGPGTLDPTAKEFVPHNRFPFPVAVGVPYPNFTAVIPPSHISTLPTRSLLLTPVPLTSETALRRDLEVFGDVRAVQTELRRYGTVTVHFYDIRHAETAFTAIRNHHFHCASFYGEFSQHRRLFAEPPPPPGLVAGQAMLAHFVVPSVAAAAAFPDAQNQGTIVVFNLDSGVSAFHLRQVFEAFGPIKELRESPWKKNQRFIEFFDTRDAAMALKNLNGKEIYGNYIFIEFSHKPGGNLSSRRFYKSSNSNTITNTQSLSPQRRRFGPKRSNSNIVASMGSMSLSEGGGNRNIGGEKQKGWNERKKGSESVSRESMENVVYRRRNWKGKQVKNHESRYLIKEDADIIGSVSKDTRTTLMIKNIPNKYSQKLLLNMLDNHCIRCNEKKGDGEPLSSYDFVYLPIDFNNKCNVGYGFVNMTTPEATLRFYKAFHLQRWDVFNSRKICEVTYARVQGLEALKEHFKNSRFPWELEHYLPLVFSPPRDGRREVTGAVPIAVMMGNSRLLRQTNSNVSCTTSDEVEERSSISSNGGVDNNNNSNIAAEDTRSSGGVVVDDDDDDDMEGKE